MALFATTAIAVAVPDQDGWYMRRADEMHLEDLPIVDLEVTDERFEGMVFTGTIESLYKQMKELKPELIPDTSDFTDSGVSTVDKRQSSINCNWYRNAPDRVGQWYFCHEGSDYLRKLGTSWCGVSAAPACARVSCSHSCGMFLCNKTGGHFRVHCGDIPDDVAAIANTCGSHTGVSGAMDFSTHFIGVRGQSC